MEKTPDDSGHVDLWESGTLHLLVRLARQRAAKGVTARKGMSSCARHMALTQEQLQQVMAMEVKFWWLQGALVLIVLVLVRLSS